MSELRFHPDVTLEIQQAVTWYEAQIRGLGQDFLDELENAFTSIYTMPLAWAAIAPGFRRYVLQRFPYSVIYRTDDAKDTLVVAVMHLHRKPDYWRNRVA